MPLLRQDQEKVFCVKNLSNGRYNSTEASRSRKKRKRCSARSKPSIYCEIVRIKLVFTLIIQKDVPLTVDLNSNFTMRSAVFISEFKIKNFADKSL